MRILNHVSPPNVFIVGAVPVRPGFPLEAYGNDGLPSKFAASCGGGDARRINPVSAAGTSPAVYLNFNGVIRG
jgi:hypothetical protein